MTKLALDSKKSRVRIRTFAQGLLARLAHDLELVCREVTGSAERTSGGSTYSSADAATVAVEVPIAQIDVAGTLRSGRVDPNGLSPSDREDCLAKMRREVFHTPSGSPGVVRVEGSLASGKATMRVIPPNGRAVSRTVDVRVESVGNDVHVSGRVDVSLEAIGSDPVKGPMNAFRVKDAVEVLFDLVFAPLPD